MQSFLIRLLIVIGVIWLAEKLLNIFNTPEPARKVMFVIVVILMVLFLVIGNFLGLNIIS